MFPRVPAAEQTVAYWKAAHDEVLGLMLVCLGCFVVAVASAQGGFPAWLGVTASLGGTLIALIGLVVFLVAARSFELESTRLAARSGAPPGAPLLPALALVATDTITQSIWNAFISFFESIWQGISTFFSTIFQGLANLVAAIFEAPVAGVQQSFGSLADWSVNYGPLAPIIEVVVVVIVAFIIVIAIWIVIRLSISQGEGAATEAEEGL